MKFKRQIKIELGLQPIDIVPLIDVLFLLLIFFMVTTSFTFQSSINVKLPKAVTSDMIKEENLVMTITSENVVYLNNTVTTLKELEDTLTKLKSKDHQLLIKADRRTSVGRIVDVWDLCRKIGLDHINIATNQDN